MAYQDDERPRRDASQPRAGSSSGGSRDGSRDGGRPGRRAGSDSQGGDFRRPREAGRGDRDSRSARTSGSGAADSREYRQVPEWANSRREPLETRRLSPLIPDEITDKDLEIGVRAQLKTLTPENAEKVARHLAMVGLLIDQDPELAHEHALAAADRAGRIAVVRETVGCTAYAVGDYTMALRELLTHRRISGSNEQIALIVDSERGLGRPERALELGRGVDRASLSAESRVNLAIAMSGARLDKGEKELALAELEIPELNPAKVFEYSAPLFFAYADVLEDLGREADSARWADFGNRAVAAYAGDEENIVVLEEYEIPVRRERSEWVERPPREDGERRGYGDRGDRGDRRDRGDRGDRRGLGDRGERRSFGDRDARPRRDGDSGARGYGRSTSSTTAGRGESAGRGEGAGRSGGYGGGSGRPNSGRPSGSRSGSGRAGGEGRPSREGRPGRDDYRPKRDS